MEIKKIWLNSSFFGILAFGFLSIIFFFPSISFSSPKLFFSDLESGPKTGWEGSTTRGAAVSVWGKEFGAIRGSSYITINGAKLTNESDYAEWGVIGTANGIPRGLERITFWIPSSAAAGAGQITITVNGETSKPLPFTIRNGNIYFISASDGNDSYNGKYAKKTGIGKGPWKRLLMISPNNNRILKPGDTIYVCGGTYSEEDDEGMLVHFRGTSGTSTMPYAVSAYPAEIPNLDLTNARRGAFYTEGGHYAPTSYWVFSKLKFSHGTVAIGTWGKNIRIVGNHFYRMRKEAWSGVVMIDTSENVYVYGNYFDHSGYDMYKHNIYIKTHNAAAHDTMVEAKNVYVGWNEFDSWTADLNPSSQTKPSRGGAIEIQTESTARSNGKLTNNIYIHDNYFHDGDSQALYLTDYTNTLIFYNNIFSNISCPHGGLLVAGQDSRSLFYNNTFYHIAPQSAPMVFMSYNSTPYWKNNIFYAYSGQSYATVESGSLLNSDHDLFYGNGSPSGSNYNVTNAIVGDPQFVNPVAGDFYLQSTPNKSPAIDAGSSSIAAVVTKDFEGNPRPQGKGFDIGAYEFIPTK